MPALCLARKTVVAGGIDGGSVGGSMPPVLNSLNYVQILQQSGESARALRRRAHDRAKAILARQHVGNAAGYVFAGTSRDGGRTYRRPTRYRVATSVDGGRVVATVRLNFD